MIPRFSLFFTCGLLLLNVSCKEVYVSAPQPVDSKNLYVFPEKYRGTWVVEEDTIIIEKDIFRYLQAEYSQFPIQELDSSYIIKDNRIYLLGNPVKELSRGFPFRRANDTVYFLERTAIEFPLGRNAFLRKIKNDHIVNVKQQNQWWESIYLKKDSKDNIIICLLDAEKLQRFSNYKQVYTYKSDYNRYDFLEAGWTKKELLQMIQKGAFSDTLLLLEPRNRINSIKANGS